MKIKNLLRLTLCMAVVASCFSLTSCGDEPPQPAELVFDLLEPADGKLSPVAAASSSVVEFVTNYAWTAEIDETATWITSTSTLSGNASVDAQTITLNFAENTTEEVRPGKVTITSNGVPKIINITQAAGVTTDHYCELINPEDAEQTFTINSSSVDVVFRSSDDWRAILSGNEDNWFSVWPMSKEGSEENQTLTINVKENDGKDGRSGEILVKSSADLEFTIKITQDGVPLYCELLNPEDKYIRIAAGGEDRKVKFRTNNVWFSMADAEYQEWFSVLPSNGPASEEAEITLHVKANTEAQSRGAIAIVLFGTDDPLTIEVIQEGTQPAETINIPDPVLKAYLVENYDVDGDGEIDTIEARAVIEINKNNAGITDLTGLEYFINLETLNLEQNSFTAVDLTPFTKLKTASFRICSSLETFTVAGNSSIESLNLLSTKVPALDLTGCTAITSLVLGNNSAISTLDGYITGGESLKSINCLLAGLTSLDMTRFTKLENLTIETNKTDITAVNFLSNPELKVFSVGFEYGSSKSIPVNVDLSACGKLERVNLASAGVTGISFPEINPELSSLSINGNKLTELTIRNSPKLGTLKCSSNQLTKLDIEGLSGLTNIEAQYNKLTTANFNGCTSLDRINMGNNEIVDLSFLEVVKDQLTSIRVEKNKIQSFNPANYPLLGTLVISDNDLHGTIDVSGMGATNMEATVSNNAYLETIYISKAQDSAMKRPYSMVKITWNAPTQAVVKE